MFLKELKKKQYMILKKVFEKISINFVEKVL